MDIDDGKINIKGSKFQLTTDTLVKPNKAYYNLYKELLLLPISQEIPSNNNSIYEYGHPSVFISG